MPYTAKPDADLATFIKTTAKNTAILEYLVLKAWEGDETAWSRLLHLLHFPKMEEIQGSRGERILAWKASINKSLAINVSQFAAPFEHIIIETMAKIRGDKSFSLEETQLKKLLPLLRIYALIALQDQGIFDEKFRIWIATTLIHDNPENAILFNSKFCRSLFKAKILTIPKELRESFSLSSGVALGKLSTKTINQFAKKGSLAALAELGVRSDTEKSMLYTFYVWTVAFKNRLEDPQYEGVLLFLQAIFQEINLARSPTAAICCYFYEMQRVLAASAFSIISQEDFLHFLEEPANQLRPYSAASGSMVLQDFKEETKACIQCFNDMVIAHPECFISVIKTLFVDQETTISFILDESLNPKARETVKAILTLPSIASTPATLWGRGNVEAFFDCEVDPRLNELCVDMSELPRAEGTENHLRS